MSKPALYARPLSFQPVRAIKPIRCKEERLNPHRDHVGTIERAHFIGSVASQSSVRRLDLISGFRFSLGWTFRVCSRKEFRV